MLLAEKMNIETIKKHVDTVVKSHDVSYDYPAESSNMLDPMLRPLIAMLSAETGSSLTGLCFVKCGSGVKLSDDSCMTFRAPSRS